MVIKNLVGVHSNQNPFYYIENELEIRVPYSTKNISIKINNQQSTFIRQITHNKSENLLFLSERQKGLSTIMMGYCHWLCTQISDMHVGVFARNLASVKSLQTLVTIKEPNITTINSGTLIHFNNGSTINFLRDIGACDKQIRYLFVDNALHFGIQEYKPLQAAMTRHGYDNGKLVVICSGENGQYQLPSVLQDSEFTTYMI